jgi:hypothetical protein
MNRHLWNFLFVSDHVEEKLEAVFLAVDLLESTLRGYPFLNEERIEYKCCREACQDSD